jgi:NADH:ubiquinone oxidoreductase subunit E/NAD-dependent dihydropyrimidine dehydrogenase PreA subunit
MTGAVMVVGGGIAGMQASLDLADSGFKVYLVDKSPAIGGVMAQLDKTFPTLDCSMCIMAPKLVEVARHPNVELLSYSEVIDVEGSAGNFTIEVRSNPRYVDLEKCTGCGVCVEGCPVQYEPQVADIPSIKENMDKDVVEKLNNILEKYEGNEGDLVPVLQDINSLYNYLPENALRYVSEQLRIPLGTVYHVASFYKSFTLEPRGRHHIRVCTGTACHVRGSSRVLDLIEKELGIKPGETSPDGEFSLETVNCLGACAMGPVVVIDEKYHSTTPSKISTLLKGIYHTSEVAL